MATSQNGWVVRTSSSGLAPLSWITGRVLPGDVFTIFDFLCQKFNATVEPIRRDQSWGWAYREVRGGSDLSNHASATAIDLNAPAHPLGRRGTFSPDQNRAIQRILNDLDAVVRWGGDYPGRPDEMHFEINASSQRVAAVAERIRKGISGGGGTAPTNPGGGGTAPAPNPNPKEEDDMTPEQDAALKVILDNQAHINRRLDEIGTEAALNRIATEVVKTNTGPITRGGVSVSLRQEIADTKTTVLNLNSGMQYYRVSDGARAGDVFEVGPLTSDRLSLQQFEDIKTTILPQMQDITQAAMTRLTDRKAALRTHIFGPDKAGQA